MQPETDSDETQKDGCRAIAHFLSQYEDDHPDSIKKRDVLLKDLCWRMSRLSPHERALVMAESWYNLLPGDVKTVFSSEALGIGEFDIVRDLEKRHKNVGIVTVLECELDAVLRAIGRGGVEKPDMQSDEGYRYWFGEVRKQDDAPVSIVITLVGTQRNIPCALSVVNLLANFEVDLLVLVGIAAGPRNRVKLGDVVCAERVYDYEHKRLELRRFFGIPSFFRIGLRRPLFLEVETEVRIAIELLEGHQNRIQSYFRELVSQLEADKLPGEYAQDFVPSLHNRATIAAGEKLIADGNLPRMCRSADQRIRAADQEDSGFAQAAKSRPINWCIFRGICDYADPGKGRHWQRIAALAAASAAVTFLKTVWKPTLPPQGN